MIENANQITVAQDELNKAIAFVIAEWKTRLDGVGAKYHAMDQDSLTAARQIHQPIEAEGDIANAFDGITYQKGATVIRMFERWVGKETFQKGIRSYLGKHRMGTATSDDLLRALSWCAKKSTDARP